MGGNIGSGEREYPHPNGEGYVADCYYHYASGITYHRLRQRAYKGEYSRRTITCWVVEADGSKRPVDADRERHWLDEDSENWDDPSRWWDL